MANELMVQFNDMRGQLIEVNKTDVYNLFKKGNENITDGEVSTFLSLCQSARLNPFMKEVWLVKYGNAPADMIIAKDAYEARADINPDYDGKQCGIIVQSKNGGEKEIDGAFVPQGAILVGGWCKVYRKSRKFPTYIRVSLKEYSTGKSTWSTKPATMIRKVAIAQALRDAFPNTFGSAYSEAEYDTFEDKRRYEDNANTNIADEFNVDDIFADKSTATEVTVSEPDYEGTPFDEAMCEQVMEKDFDNGDWERISYSEYKNSKGLYEADNSSYDSVTKTILARRIG